MNTKLSLVMAFVALVGVVSATSSLGEQELIAIRRHQAQVRASVDTFNRLCTAYGERGLVSELALAAYDLPVEKLKEAIKARMSVPENESVSMEQVIATTLKEIVSESGNAKAKLYATVLHSSCSDYLKRLRDSLANQGQFIYQRYLHYVNL